MLEWLTCNFCGHELLKFKWFINHRGYLGPVGALEPILSHPDDNQLLSLIVASSNQV